MKVLLTLKIVVADMISVIQQNRLQWYGHVLQKEAVISDHIAIVKLLGEEMYRV